MKLSSLAVASLALPLFAAAAHAGSGESVYYFQNGQRVVVTQQQAAGMTEPQIEDVCAKMDASVAAVKAVDENAKAGGDIIQQYVTDNYTAMSDTLGLADSVTQEYLPNVASGMSLAEIAAKAMAVEKHNAIADKGQAAISKVQQDMLKAVGVQSICALEDPGGCGGY